MKSTKMGWAFLGLTLILILAGMNTRTNLLHLLTSFLIALWFLSRWLNKKNARELSVAIETSKEVMAGEKTSLHYFFSNATSYSKYGITCSDPVIQEKIYLPEVPARATVEASRRKVFSQRGVWQWNQVSLSSEYPFGFFISQWDHKLKNTLYVLPATRMMVNLEVMEVFVRHQEGHFLTPSKTLSQHLAGLREYRPGDTPRAIHWKATAKTGDLTVKEYEEELPTSATVFLESYGTRNTKEFEDLMILSASLLKNLHERDYRWSFIQGKNKVPYSGEGRHYLQAMRKLAEAQVPSQMDLAQMDVNVIDTFSHVSAFLLVTSHLDEKKMRFIQPLDNSSSPLAIICLSKEESLGRRRGNIYQAHLQEERITIERC